MSSSSGFSFAELVPGSSSCFFCILIVNSCSKSIAFSAISHALRSRQLSWRYANTSIMPIQRISFLQVRLVNFYQKQTRTTRCTNRKSMTILRNPSAKNRQLASKSDTPAAEIFNRDLYLATYISSSFIIRKSQIHLAKLFHAS